MMAVNAERYFRITSSMKLPSVAKPRTASIVAPWSVQD
jgi:hypothetical protein